MGSAERQLKKLRKVAKADPGFERALRSELSSSFDELYPALRNSWSRMMVVPVAVAVVFVTMGVGSYAYASPTVTDDHVLYPLKTGIESVESALPRSANGSALFHARMMERRIAEGEVMMRVSGVPAEKLEGIANEFTKSIDQLEIREDASTSGPVIQQLQVQVVRYKYLMEAHMEESNGGNFQGLGEIIKGSNLTSEEKGALFNRLDQLIVPSVDSEDGQINPRQMREGIQGVNVQ